MMMTIRWFLLLLILMAAAAQAQPGLELRLLRPHVPDYYYYSLHFAAFCGEEPLYDLQEHQLILREEHGLIDSNDYIINSYPSPNKVICYDAVMVLDNSNGLAGEVFPLLVEGGMRFVDLMSQDCQQAAVIAFNEKVNILEFLTNEKENLRQALQQMAPSGNRALYDAINAGITENITHGLAPNRVVLAFTTGDDNASGIDPRQLIEDALWNNVRIIIVGYGSDLNPKPLEELARESGGVFIHIKEAAQVPEEFARLEGFIHREFDEYVLVRRTNQMDMTNKLIRLRLEACGDSIWVERVFFPEIPTDATTPGLPSEQPTLAQNYPNPISSSVPAGTIKFTMPDRLAGMSVSLQLFDLLGRKRRVLFTGDVSAGINHVRFRLESLPPGMYIYRLQAGETVLSRSMIVVQ